MSLEQPGPVHRMGYDRGAADADALELTPEQKRQFLDGLQPDPPETSPRSPLSGEHAGESMTEILGDNYDEDDPEKYEQGYLLGWEERLLHRCMDS